MYIHQAELKYLKETTPALSNAAKLQSLRGATIVEVLVAVLLFSLAIGPILYGAVSALTTATTIRDNLIAAHLAGEGVEIVRSIRDANWFNGRAFNAGLANGTYQAQWDSAALVPTTNALILKSSSGVYNYTVGTVTPFRRNIVVFNASATRILVFSVVTWTERNRNKNIVVESQIFDWGN